MNSVLYIKNMVCDRCKMAVEKVLRDNNMQPLSVELGEVHIEKKPNETQYKQLKGDLEALGFELLDDRKHQTIAQIKTAIIQLVH